MQKQKRVLVIPTHRLSIKSVDSLVHELLFAAERYPDADFSYILIDSSPESEGKENREFMNKLKTTLKNENIYYFSVDELNAIYNEIVRAADIKNKEKILPLLTTGGLSYGIAANRTFLIASLFGADYVHRRDSDVYLQELDNGTLLKPIELEMEYLGKRVSDINKLVERKEAYPGDETIYMVGAGYKGNWPVDYEDLAQTNMEALYKLQHLVKPLLTLEQVKEIVDARFIKGSKEIYEEDKLAFAIDNFIEAGNYSLYEIFKYLPYSPAIETSGTDYLHHALLGNSKKPMLYHNRRVVHEFTPERKGEAHLFTYHLRLAMYRCLARYYVLLNKEVLKDNQIFIKDGKFNYKDIGNFLVEISNKDLKEEQINVLDSMIKVYEGTNDDKYSRLAKHIEDNKEYVINKSAKDVYNHGILVLEWNKIMEFARENNEYLLGLIKK